MPAGVYVRWVWCRAVLHRGWWLVTSIYLVADARLPAAQLVLIGVAQAVVGLVFEVPAGALPLTRGLGAVWVNGRTTSAVRVTVHSLLAQVDYVGTILCGLAVAYLPALPSCAVLLVAAVVVIKRGGTPKG